MKTLEENQAFVTALGEVVKEFGEDFVYTREKCVYFVDKHPSCLIGMALSRVGHTEEEISTLPTSRDYVPVSNENAAEIMEKLGYDVRICQAALLAQDVQDERGTWGDAHNHFISYLRDSTKLYDLSM